MRAHTYTRNTHTHTQWYAHTCKGGGGEGGVGRVVVRSTRRLSVREQKTHTCIRERVAGGEGKADTSLDWEGTSQHMTLRGRGRAGGRGGGKVGVRRGGWGGGGLGRKTIRELGGRACVRDGRVCVRACVTNGRACSKLKGQIC